MVNGQGQIVTAISRLDLKWCCSGCVVWRGYRGGVIVVMVEKKGRMRGVCGLD